MESSATSPPNGRLDLKLFSQFLREFNILRRHFIGYPEGHPLVTGSLSKVVDVYQRLMKVSDTIVIGVTKNNLMVGGILLDKKDVMAADFARTFFSLGIGTLSFHPGLTAEELKRLLMILNLKRDEIRAAGGVEPLWSKARISSIAAGKLALEALTLTEDGTAPPLSGSDLWERLARGLVENAIDSGGMAERDFDPEIVAEILSGQSSKLLDSVSAQAMDYLLPEDGTSSSCNNPELIAKLASFVTNLSPPLREQFLSSSFSSSRPDGSRPVADILEAMPAEHLLSMLSDISTERMSLPPVLLELVHKIASSKTANANSAALADEEYEHLSALFCEHSSEQYIPSEYQRKLNAMMSAKDVPLLDTDIGGLLDTLQESHVEHSTGVIILQLARRGGDMKELETLAQNMEEMCGYFLQTGEYQQVLDLIKKTNDPFFPIQFRRKFAQKIAKAEFLEEILQGLTTWGKSRYDAISSLIRAIGAPFVEPLLERLASEESLSLRRFIIMQLQELGPVARDGILRRLNDERWYYVRNLLVILSSMDDPTLAPYIRPLLKHPHPTISVEALRTLQQLGDPQVDRQILLDLESGNRDTQLGALQLAGRSRSPEIFRSLLGIACKGGLSPAETGVRCAAIKALGEMGQIDALEDLFKVLTSSSLIRGKALLQVKLEIIRSLLQYPPGEAAQMLQYFSKGTDEVARQAAETLKALHVKTYEQ